MSLLAARNFEEPLIVGNFLAELGLAFELVVLYSPELVWKLGPSDEPLKVT